MKQKNDEIDDALEGEMMRLVEHIHLHTPHDGDFENKILNCRFGKYSKGGAMCVKTFTASSLLLVAQGAKKMTIGQEVYQVNTARMMLLPVALPVAMHTLQASPEKPFLNIGLYFNAQRIAESALKMYPHGIHKEQRADASLAASADMPIINAVNRLLLCLSNSDDAHSIAPLIRDEILIRVLRSPIGMKIGQMGFTDVNMQGVIRAIAWLGEHFSQQIRVADLAKMAYMSESTFHKHFKNVTFMTPLQYQKSLRLHEARRLMLAYSMEASAASGLVGYVSDAQFNRDYRRCFGLPPKRDMTTFRQQ